MRGHHQPSHEVAQHGEAQQVGDSLDDLVWLARFFLTRAHTSAHSRYADRHMQTLTHANPRHPPTPRKAVCKVCTHVLASFPAVRMGGYLGTANETWGGRKVSINPQGPSPKSLVTCESERGPELLRKTDSRTLHLLDRPARRWAYHSHPSTPTPVSNSFGPRGSSPLACWPPGCRTCAAIGH